MTTMVIDASVILVYLLEEQKSVADKVASLLKKQNKKALYCYLHHFFHWRWQMDYDLA